MSARTHTRTYQFNKQKSISHTKVHLIQSKTLSQDNNSVAKATATAEVTASTVAATAAATATEVAATTLTPNINANSDSSNHLLCNAGCEETCVFQMERERARE